MRNAFVVLVSLCIGLASGFIVPSGLELVDVNHALLADNNGKESEEAKAATLQGGTGFIVLPFGTRNKDKIDLETYENRIKDKELYDQDTTQHNNVNERSFIYINQKFKTPVLNQLYTSQDLLRENYMPIASNIDTINYKQYQAKYIPGFIIPKKKNEYFEANIGRTGTKNLYFPPAEPYNKETDKAVKNDDKHGLNPKKVLNKVVDEQREYVELLKPPILRPVGVSDKKENKMWALHVPPYPNYQPVNKHMHVPNVPIDPRQFSMGYYDNYGFPSPYGYQRSISPMSYKPEELGMVTDSSVRKIIHTDNNNVEVNKLLDRYLKESLEDQVTNERMTVKNTNCSYSSCVLKSTKQYLNNRMRVDAECKCGRRLNVLKQRESNGFNEKETKTDKEFISSVETTTVYITPRSAEMGDYGDMLAEEMNIKRLIED